ncbi:MAG: hypothetical protein ACREUA_10050 [Burkholderiales bacterium]
MHSIRACKLPATLEQEVRNRAGDHPSLDKLLHDAEWALGCYRIGITLNAPGNETLPLLESICNAAQQLLAQAEAIDPRSVLSLRDGFYLMPRRQPSPDPLENSFAQLGDIAKVAHHAIGDIRKEWRVDMETYARASAQIEAFATQALRLWNALEATDAATQMALRDGLFSDAKTFTRDYLENFKLDLRALVRAGRYAIDIVNGATPALDAEQRLRAQIAATFSTHLHATPEGSDWLASITVKLLESVGVGTVQTPERSTFLDLGA